eukprot:27090_1
MSDFHFEKWIVEHGLNSVKDIFEHHKATTLESLKFTSASFQSVVQDQRLFAQSQMIPKILIAVQQIENMNPLRIIVSEQEQTVIDQIEGNLQKLQEIEHEKNVLNQKYTNSLSIIKQEKLKQIEIATNKVKNIFKQLSEKLNDQQNIFLKQIENMKSTVSEDQDDEKESDGLKNLGNAIQTIRQYLKEKKHKYNQFTLTNDNRQERKIKIINMGKETKNKFNKTYEELQKNINNINQCISKHETMKINTDFILNEKRYSKIVENLNVIGKYIDKCHEDNNDVEDIVKKLQHELELNQITIKTIKQQFDAEKTKNQANQSVMNTLNQQLTSEKTKILELQNANKSYETTINTLNQQLSAEKI